jgi:hypothetical protein
MTRDDLPAVAALYERTMRSGTSSPPPGLAASFARQQFDHPWFDPEIASLVCERDDGLLVGFIAVYARRIVVDGRPARAACSGPLVADAEAGVVAPGVLLTRAYLNGPQELSVTDGATWDMRRMWTRLGGVVWPLTSITWTRVFAPLSAFAAYIETRRRPIRPIPGRRVVDALDRVAALPVRRRVRPPETSTTSEPLTPAAMVEHLDAVTVGLGIRPAYDEEYLGWLLAEMGAVESRGPLHARLVRDERGEVLGWYVAYVPAGGIAEALQVTATAATAGAVLDDLCAYCAGAGAAAVRGRLDPWLFDAASERKFILRSSAVVLIHARERALARAVLAGESSLTRLDGEWWMAPQLDPFDYAAPELVAPGP